MQRSGSARPARPVAPKASYTQAAVKERLAPYKYPRFIELVADLPKTAAGKVQRYKLREREAGRLA
ncbi:MAG: hypothetical protein KJ015_20325 [Myxococcales bacterium]|nr:hypothetical protein [Myxococcales bacterium]